MRVLGAGVVGAAVVGLVLGGAGGAGAGGLDGEPGPIAPEADVAFHGDVSMSEGRVRVWLAPQNHGPSDVAGATVRLTWSVPLTDAQPGLPGTCVRSGARQALCRTGALGAGSRGEPTEVEVRLKGAPREVVVRIGTAWNGGATDRNPQNNVHEVLALDTGDSYFF